MTHELYTKIQMFEYASKCIIKGLDQHDGLPDLPPPAVTIVLPSDEEIKNLWEELIEPSVDFTETTQRQYAIKGAKMLRDRINSQLTPETK